MAYNVTRFPDDGTGPEVADVIREGRQVTHDLKLDRDDPFAVRTSQFADEIIEKLEAAKVRA